LGVVVLPIRLLLIVVVAVPVALMPYIPVPLAVDELLAVSEPNTLLEIFTTPGEAADVVMPLMAIEPLLLIVVRDILPVPVAEPIVLPVIFKLPAAVSIP
jgi:hypothetical protein